MRRSVRVVETRPSYGPGSAAADLNLIFDESATEASVEAAIKAAADTALRMYRTRKLLQPATREVS